MKNVNDNETREVIPSLDETIISLILNGLIIVTLYFVVNDVFDIFCYGGGCEIEEMCSGKISHFGSYYFCFVSSSSASGLRPDLIKYSNKIIELIAIEYKYLKSNKFSTLAVIIHMNR